MLETSIAEDFHPTIGSAYAPIEAYLKQMQRVDPSRSAPEHAPTPVDALLLTLFLEFQSTPVSVVDFASDATEGLSALICATSRQSRIVHEFRNEIHSERSLELSVRNRIQNEKCSSTIDCFAVSDQGPLASEWLPLAESLQQEPAVVFVFQATKEKSLAAQITSCLKAVPQGICFVLGLADAGRCRALPVLLNCEVDGQLVELRLIRELDAAFAKSQLCCVSRAGNLEAELTLSRIANLYQSNFDYLDLHQRTVALTAESRMSAEEHARLVSKSHELRQQISQLEDSSSDLRQHISNLENYSLDLRQYISELEHSSHDLRQHIFHLEHSSTYLLGKFLRGTCYRFLPLARFWRRGGKAVVRTLRLAPK